MVRLTYVYIWLQQGIDVSKDPMAMQRLREAAEKAKIELSSSLQVCKLFHFFIILLKWDSINTGSQKRVCYWVIFLISQPKHVVGTQKNCLIEISFEHPSHMFKLIDKKIITILR